MCNVSTNTTVRWCCTDLKLRMVLSSYLNRIRKMANGCILSCSLVGPSIIDWFLLCSLCYIFAERERTFILELPVEGLRWGNKFLWRYNPRAEGNRRRRQSAMFRSDPTIIFINVKRIHMCRVFVFSPKLYSQSHPLSNINFETTMCVCFTRARLAVALLFAWVSSVGLGYGCKLFHFSCASPELSWSYLFSLSVQCSIILPFCMGCYITILSLGMYHHRQRRKKERSFWNSYTCWKISMRKQKVNSSFLTKIHTDKCLWRYDPRAEGNRWRR
jgi:hypothetical protein